MKIPLLKTVQARVRNIPGVTLFLAAVFVVSLLLRLVGQPNYPDCLHRDEVQFGYNAYSLLETGRDEWGELLPLHFKFNGEYHVPSVFYLIALAMAFVGPTDTAIRLPAIVLGALIPILGFFFAKELTGNKKIGYFIAVLLAINPWQIINARGSGEISIISQFFGLLGFYFLFLYLKRHSFRQLFIACLSFIVAYFSYIASRLDIPLLLGAFLLIFYRKMPSQRLRFQFSP